MSRFLIGTLLVSGVLTALVFLSPSVILLAAIALVIPGLVLMVVPNVFLYASIFSLAWFGLRRTSHVLAVSMGIGAATAVAWGVPGVLNHLTQAAVLAAREEIIPAVPVAPARTIALQNLPESELGRCTDLCRTLLYNRVVDRVLVPAPAPQTWARPPQTPPVPTLFGVEAAASCAATDVRPGGDNWTAQAPAIDHAVRQRIAAGECLAGEPAGDASPDLTIRRTARGTRVAEDRLALRPGRVATRSLEILAGDNVVARVQEHRAFLFVSPLQLSPYGSGLDLKGWEWSRFRLPAAEWTADMVPALRRVTSLDLDVPRGAGQADLRHQIDAVLADRARPASDGAFALVADYFEAVRRDGVQPGDRERLLMLVGDDRGTVSWRFPSREAFGTADTAPLLRDALLDRLLRLAGAPPGAALRGLVEVAADLPRDTFREPDPRLDALLAPAATRVLFIRLIERLGERGPASVPTLLAIIRDASGGGQRTRSVEVASAARRGLCLAGDPAALPALRQMQADGSVPAGVLDSPAWRVLFVRLGAPAAAFDKPENSGDTVEQYRRRLEREAQQRC